MDLDIIETVFKIGKIFALTPFDTTSKPITNTEVLHKTLIFLLHFIGAAVSSYRKRSIYVMYTQIQFILRVLMDVTMLLSTIYHLLVSPIFKRNQWFKLINHLRVIPGHVGTKKSRYFFFVLSLVSFCVGTIVFQSIAVSTLGFDYIKTYTVEYLQIFSLMFHITGSNVILARLLARYRYQNSLFGGLLNARGSHCHLKTTNKVLTILKQNLVLLKVSNSIFNDIFGWTYLLGVTFGVSRTLVYLDATIKQDNEKTDNVIYTMSRIGVIVMFWIGCIRTVVLCDSILKQFEQIKRKTLRFHMVKMESIFYNHSAFVDIVKECGPHFTAARFFTINRSTIFSVLNAVITFLIVMVQFKLD